MKRVSPLVLVCVIVVLALAAPVPAAIFTYDFTGHDQSSSWNPGGGAAGISINNAHLSNFTKTGLGTGVGGTDVFNGKPWTTGATGGETNYANLTGSVHTGKYYEFSVVPDAGHEIDYSSITFDMPNRGGGGPRTWVVRSSLDGYASNLPASGGGNVSVQAGDVFFLTQDVAAATAPSTVSLSGPAFQGVTGAAAFRLYAFNAESTGSGWMIDNVAIDGTVSAVPGPISGTLKVDFDDNDAGINTQPGFTSVTTAGGPVAAVFGQGGAIDLSFSSNGSIDDRNRGPMDAGQLLAEVGRDFIFGNRNAGATRIDLNVADLAAGNYTLTTYHHDNNGSSPFDIDIDVDTGAGFVDAATVARSFGTNPAGGVAAATFSFDANGVDDATIRMVASTNGHLINGFELTPNPQPGLRVDVGLNGHDVQPGFFSFPRGSSAGSDDETQRFLSSLGTGGTVDVKLTNANVFRDRGDVTGSLGDLAEDFFAHQNEMTLTLSGLAAGEYLITTYHHDATVDHDLIGVRLTDANNTAADLGLTVDQTTGTSPTDIASLDFRFEADGINDVDIQFFEVNSLGTPSIVLSGLDLRTAQVIPEPATMALVGLAVCGLGGYVRRRRTA